MTGTESATKRRLATSRQPLACGSLFQNGQREAKADSGAILVKPAVRPPAGGTVHVPTIRWLPTLLVRHAGLKAVLASVETVPDRHQSR
jgi:hypothetical protein